MSLDVANLGDEVLAFLAERHLATLTNVRANGTPHVVPVGFTYEPATRLARVITSGPSVKAKLAEHHLVCLARGILADDGADRIGGHHAPDHEGQDQKAEQRDRNGE